MNQDGVFSDQTEPLAPRLLEAGLVNSAVWSDYDDDGWVDLLVASEWGPIRVWKNENGKLKETTKISVFQISMDGGHPFCPLISIPMGIWTTLWEILGITQSILPAPGNHLFFTGEIWTVAVSPV